MPRTLSDTSDFKIEATAPTDLWRKPPNTYVKNHVRQNLVSDIKVNDFEAVHVHFKAKWRRKYDQGGVVLWFSGASATEEKWIKAGVEFYQGKPYIGIVCCDNWADWSLFPISAPEYDDWEGKEVSITIQRESDENGISLWIYQVEHGHKMPVRECTWALAKENLNSTLHIDAYACRPTVEKANSDDDDVLVVQFGDCLVQGRE
jgi:uncharacterized protein